MTNPRNGLHRSQEINWIELNLRAKEDGTTRRILASTKFYSAHSVYGVQCALFDGVDDYLSIADNSALSMGNIDFAGCAWVNLTAFSSCILSKGNISVANATEYLLKVDSSGQVIIQIENGATSDTLTSTERLVLGRWYFVAFWYDSVNDILGLRIDDRSETKSNSFGSQDTAHPLHIGRDNAAGALYFDGKISRVGIWKRVLNEADFVALYNAGEGVNYADLTAALQVSLSAWWDLDESSGTRNDSHSTNHLADNGSTGSSTAGPGNAPIYPLLAEDPAIGFNLGPFAAEQVNPSFTFFANASIGNIFETVASLMTAYDVFGQAIKVYYASKYHDQFLVNNADFPQLRGTYEAATFQITQDAQTMALSCIDRWFKDKIIGKPIDLATYPNAWDQEYGKTPAQVWGDRLAAEDGINDQYGPVPSCRWIDIVTDNPYTADYSKAGSKILYMLTGNGFQTDASTASSANLMHYVFNKDDPGVGADPWQKLDFQADINDRAVEGLSSDLSAATYTVKLNMITYPIAGRAFTVSSARICTGFRCRIEDKNSNCVDADGPVRITLEHAEIQNTNNLFLKRTLREKLIRCGDSRILSAGQVIEIWDEPVVLLPDVQYAIVVRWLRDDAAPANHELDMMYTPSSPTDTDTFYVESFGNDGFLTKTGSGTGLSIAVDCAWSESSDYDRGASQGYASRKIWGSYQSALTDPIAFQACTIKAFIKGIEDIGGAHAAGGSTDILVYPQPIISSILNDPSVIELSGAGVFDFDPASPDAAYNAIMNQLSRMNIVIESPILASELILLICEHAKLRIYKQRNGLLKVAYPFNYDSTSAQLISEADLQADMILQGIAETDPSQIVNDFKALYRRDYLERERDPDVLLRLGTNRYASSFELSIDASTDSDTLRQAEMQESEDAFGKKEWRRELDFFDLTSPTRDLVNYLADRYSQKQRRVTIQVLKRDFFDLFLLDQIELEHTKLCGAAVDTASQPYVRNWDQIKIVDEEHAGITFTAAQALASYHDGIPSINLASGIFQGEVISLQEQGALLLITIESIPYIEEMDAT